MQYETLIFDLDGTPSDQKLGFVYCMNYAFASFDYRPKAENVIANNSITLGDRYADLTAARGNELAKAAVVWATEA